jgi:hypothetical protein
VSHGIHLLWSGDQHVIAGPIEQGSRDNGPLKRRYQHNPFVAVQGFHLQKVYTGASDTNHCTWSIHWHLSRCNHHLAVSQGVSRDLRPIATQVCCDQMGWVRLVCSILRNSYSVSTTHRILAILANGALARISEALHMVRRFSNGHQA